MRKAYQYRYVINDMYPNEDAIAKGDAKVLMTPASLVTGEVFIDKTPIYQLGIQALPGTKFYLNESEDPVIVGATGIYELDLREKSTVSVLKFAPESVNRINQALSIGTGYLIVDIIYEEE